MASRALLDVALGRQALLDVGLGRRVLQKLDMDAEYKGNVKAAVSCKNSPCLAKAQRVLQSLTWMPNMKAMSRPQEMDAENEGNVETSGED